MSDKDIDLKREALRDLLECTICLEVASSPIYNCVPNGHIVCGICNEKVKKCGLCQSPLFPSALGEALSRKVELTTSCPNSEAGCSQAVRCSEMKEHIANCYFQEVICNKGTCAGSKFAFSTYPQHMKEIHRTKSIKLGAPDAISFRKEKKDPGWARIAEFENEMFCCHLMVSPTQNFFFAWVTVFGDKEKAKEFNYKFCITCEDNVRTWEFPVLPYHDYKQFKEPSQFFVSVPFDNLFSEHPLDEEKLSLSVMIDLKSVKITESKVLQYNKAVKK